MIVRAAEDDDIRFVLERAAPERVAEMMATHWQDDPAYLCAELVCLKNAPVPAGREACRIFAMVHDPDASRCPFAIVGVLPFGPGWGGMIWAAIAGAPLRTLSGYRWWRDYFVGKVLAEHYRRVEFTALASDIESREWLKSVRFTEEGIAYRQGKRGEDFVHFAWVNPDPTVGILPAR